MSLLDEGMIKTMLWSPQSIVNVCIIVDNSQRFIVSMSANLSRRWWGHKIRRKVMGVTSRLHVLSQ